jgi:hypothetical protein
MRKSFLLCGSAAFLACSVVQASDIIGFDMRADNYVFHTTTDNFVANYVEVGTVQPWDSFAIDLSLDAQTMYAVLYDGADT